MKVVKRLQPHRNINLYLSWCRTVEAKRLYPLKVSGVPLPVRCYGTFQDLPYYGKTRYTVLDKYISCASGTFS